MDAERVSLVANLDPTTAGAWASGLGLLVALAAWAWAVRRAREAGRGEPPEPPSLAAWAEDPNGVPDAEVVAVDEHGAEFPADIRGRLELPRAGVGRGFDLRDRTSGRRLRRFYLEADAGGPRVVVVRR